MSHSYGRGKIANSAATVSVLVSQTAVFKLGGIDNFRSLRSTSWMSFTSTRGDSRRTSAGLWLVQIITWRSRDNKRRGVSRGSQLTAHKSPRPFCFHLKEQTWLSHAWCTECPLKLAPIADQRMWDQFNKQNLTCMFMDPLWQLAKKLWHVNSVFFDLSDDLISQSTRYRKRFLTAVLRACASTLPSRLSAVGDPSPSISTIELLKRTGYSGQVQQAWKGTGMERSFFQKAWKGNSFASMKR